MSLVPLRAEGSGSVPALEHPPGRIVSGGKWQRMRLRPSLFVFSETGECDKI